MNAVTNYTGVYHDTGVSLWQFDQLSNFELQFTEKNYYVGADEIQNFLVSDYQIKIACYHVPFPDSRLAWQSWISRFHQTYSHVNYSIIFCSELHSPTVSQLIELDLPNVSIFICGKIHHDFKHATIYSWLNWFITSVHFYKHVYPSLLEEKLINKNKTKFFDMLLGYGKPHRDFVYNYVKEKNLFGNNVITYHRSFSTDLKRDNIFVFEEEGCEFYNHITYTSSVNPVKYYGYEMYISQVIPISIYNQTHYSLIAETNAVNQFNFFTEKTAKPIIAKRLFVAIAGKDFLKSLKELGFQTFDNVIDESYDQVANHKERWRLAMDQVAYLNSQNFEDVYSKVKDRLEHNYQLIMNKNWLNECTQQLFQIVQGIFNEKISA